MATTKQSDHPRDISSAGIVASIEKMEAALIELNGERAALQAARRGLLLSETSVAIERHDARIHALGLDVERIEAQTEVLRADLLAARGRERVARIEAMQAEVASQTEIAALFWTERYEALAREIADGVALTKAAYKARDALNTAIEKAAANPAVVAAGGVPTAAPLPTFPWDGRGEPWQRLPYSMICLPATGDGPSILWPNGYLLKHASELRRLAPSPFG